MRPVSYLGLCPVCGSANSLGSENHLVGVWFSILVLHPQILAYAFGLREKGIFPVKFKCHLHLEALTGSRGYSFGIAIVWTLLKTELSIFKELDVPFMHYLIYFISWYTVKVRPPGR